MTMDFAAIPLVANLLIVAAGAVAVWWAGTRLAGHADEIAEITGIGSAFVGMMLLGGITSLPEIAVSVSAGFSGAGQLAVNNLLGSIALQVVVLAVGDWVLGGRALSFVIGRPTVLLQGLFGALLLAAVCGALAVGDVAFLGAGAWSLGLFCAALGLLWVVAVEERSDRESWQPAKMPELEEALGGQGGHSLRHALAMTAVTAAVILAAGVVLSQAADAIAVQSGLGASFVGATLLGAVTSLPEISTLVAAIRLGRYEMAFGDIFGTNILNVALLYLIDLAFPGGPVLATLGPAARLTAALGAVLTLLYVAGLVERRDRTLGRLGVDSWAVIAAYAGGVALLYAVR